MKVLRLCVMWICLGFSLALFAGNPVGGDFVLTDHNGERFELSQLQKKVVLLFFGYTSCPDVCPTEMLEITRVMNALGRKSEKLSAVFVTVDPEHDSPEVLRAYLDYFHDNIIGLTGSAKEIEQVTKMYNTSFHKIVQGDQRYTLEHPANLYVIDPQGNLHSIVPFGFPAEHVVRVVENLLAGEL